MIETKGELVYRCHRCGALVRHAYPDIWPAIEQAAEGKTNQYHQCTETEVGMTVLLGANISD